MQKGDQWPDQDAVGRAPQQQAHTSTKIETACQLLAARIREYQVDAAS